jgi:hypothetical protein
VNCDNTRLAFELHVETDMSPSRRSLTVLTRSTGTGTVCYIDSATRDYLEGSLATTTACASATAYEVRGTPSSGFGVFATVPLQKGQLVLRDQAAVLLSDAFHRTPEVLRSAFDLLDPAIQQTINTLSSSFPAEEPPFGTYKTNCHGFDLSVPGPDDDSDGDGQYLPHSGLFPLACRTNHSCSPNATFSFNPAMLSLQIRTLSAVDAGEEITISYFPSQALLLPRHVRRANIIRSRNFICHCALCALPDEQSDAVDDKLDELDGVLDSTSATLPELEEAIDTLASLRQNTAGLLFAQKALDLAAHQRDETAARRWAKRTKEEWITRLGGEADIVKELADVERDPREHQGWAKRRLSHVRV